MRPFAERFLAVTLVGLVLGIGTGARADLILTTEAAGVQATSVAGVTTETFDSFNSGYFGGPLVTSVGTFQSAGFILNADNYGGAGGIGKYVQFGYSSGSQTAALTLSGPKAFLGFWWSAADAGNSVDFLSGGAVIAHLDASTVLAALGSGYLGNPNANFLNGDPTEKFAYLNVFGTSGTTFDKVIFNDTDKGTGFELDNLSIRASAVPPPFPGTVIPNAIRAVPEPGSMALMGIGGLGLLAYVRRHRRKQVAV